MSKFILSFLFATLAVAQTRVDIQTQTFGYIPTAGVERTEDDWCPSPTFSRTSDTVLAILPTVSVTSKCYLHFSSMPVSVKEFTTPATVTIQGLKSDLLFVYWQIVNDVAQLFVSSKYIEQSTCTNCTLVLRTEDVFPKGSVIVGMYGIEFGKLIPSGHPLISTHQIALADSTAMLVQYDPGAGYIFRLQGPVTSPAAAQQAEKLKEAQVNLEVANANSLVRALETTTAPVNKLMELESKVSTIEKALAKVESSIPAKDSDVSILRTAISQAQQELTLYRGNMKQTMKESADLQLEQITLQYQKLQRLVEDSVNKRLVSPPVKPSSKCSQGEYSQDAKYKYECLRGLWYRFAIDSGWK